MRKLIALASAATLTLSGAAVHAQVLEEVTVTAQKREQSINDVPITITALSDETITSLGVRSMEDMARTTPGLVVNQTAGTGTSSWTIRGVGFQDYSTAATSTVGIYFDEIAFPYAVMATGQFYDVERIEVLKGPQGDLYGRN
ncbi:MAG: Plug domain-containing protein, partial [Gammaproteobacteria bacterium]|nr:Plug domain-containing protein [Gammaproteobacteria bacterium]